ncbi:TolC family protein [Microvirga rosea]|uniref:TolC family protein n=1 Tax=Microvirga rosea TaxID=2715425 RepID=UPI001D0B0F6B|nr:TolC family protein [Microvirga rosea]MCB8820583.1 TolC family protein [Microvirga rosea]
MRPKLLSVALLCLGMAGCALTPEPFTAEEHLLRASVDRAQLDGISPVPVAPITLEEAQARAVAYNLDNRLQMFNAVLQDRQLDLTKFDLLPSITANAGYVARNKELVSSSRSILTGQISEDETVSVDRTRGFGDLSVTWNVIDLGVSYLQSRQQADRALVAREQRRRVVNNIFQQVRSAYWTAVAAERIRPSIRPILADARRALGNSRALEEQRAQQPMDSLRYQRGLLELIQQLESVDDQLAIAKIQLAQLMGLRPGTPYRLALPASNPALPGIRLTVDQMERIALVNRPEIREEGYNTRIAQLEGRRALLKLVPGVSMLASLNADSNSYLLYNNWAEAGARVTASLVNLMSVPTVMKLGEAQRDIAETRRLAMSMAVLAQVQVAAQQYQLSRKGYERAQSIARIDQRIASLSKDASDAQTSSELDRIRDQANAVLAELSRSRNYAELQNSYATIFVTLGLDPLPIDVDSTDLPSLVAAIKQKSREWAAGKMDVPKLDIVQNNVTAAAVVAP